MKEDWWLIRIREKVWQGNRIRNRFREPGERRGDPVALKKSGTQNVPKHLETFLALKKIGTQNVPEKRGTLLALKKFGTRTDRERNPLSHSKKISLKNLRNSGKPSVALKKSGTKKQEVV